MFWWNLWIRPSMSEEHKNFTNCGNHKVQYWLQSFSTRSEELWINFGWSCMCVCVSVCVRARVYGVWSFLGRMWNTERVGVTVMLLILIGKCPFRTSAVTPAAPDHGFSWFSSVPTGICRDSTQWDCGCFVANTTYILVHSCIILPLEAT
jgi:hypothetical protein